VPGQWVSDQLASPAAPRNVLLLHLCRSLGLLWGGICALTWLLRSRGLSEPHLLDALASAGWACVFLHTAVYKEDFKRSAFHIHCGVQAALCLAFALQGVLRVVAAEERRRDGEQQKKLR
jgi:hypothetical protein